MLISFFSKLLESQSAISESAAKGVSNRDKKATGKRYQRPDQERGFTERLEKGDL